MHPFPNSCWNSDTFHFLSMSLPLLVSSVDKIWGQLLFFIFLIDGKVKMFSFVLQNLQSYSCLNFPIKVSSIERCELGLSGFCPGCTAARSQSIHAHSSYICTWEQRASLYTALRITILIFFRKDDIFLVKFRQVWTSVIVLGEHIMPVHPLLKRE